MAILEFNDLSFEEEKDSIKVNFLNIFYTYIPKENISKISEFNINGNSIEFKGISEQSASKKFNFVLLRAFDNLKSKLTGKKTIYIHRSSGIPLIGNVSFGIIDRNTSLIEIKPITGCNLDCIYCSVNQSKRIVDYVVEKDYLVDELIKLIKIKGEKNLEIHIGVNGEPLFYSPLVELISAISKIKEVSRISIDTNGTLLTEKKVDELVKAGLSQFNLSINAINPELAERISGKGKAYDVGRILSIAKYIAKKADVIITPVLIPGINENEIPKLIEFAKLLDRKQTIPIIGIQNFLNYKYGKNPVKQLDWNIFYKKIKELEKEHSIRLILSEDDFKIKKTKTILKKPFKKGDTIKAFIVCKGNFNNEMIAVAGERNISIVNCANCHINKKVTLKIIHSKHNIFVAELA